jgi:enterochelin esterase-like enzyme
MKLPIFVLLSVLPGALGQTETTKAARVVPAPPIVSVEVAANRTVVFRLRAPEANDVKVGGDFVSPPQPLSKDADGVWSVTLGPLRPAIYSYTFRLDGVAVLDPANPMIQLGERNSASMFEVPGDRPADYDWQAVPHGTVHINYYNSKTLGVPRRIDVYTPPGYETSRESYPVLYLLHGSGDTEAGWTAIGRAHLILDNLIASGRAKPMIVVMPYGRARQDVYLAPFGTVNPDAAGFEKDLLNDVIPFAEKLYRVTGRADDRAIAGLSMGGGQALRIGLGHLETFRAIGVFSAGIRPNTAEADRQLFTRAAETKVKPRVFYVACGKADAGFANVEALHAALEQAQIKHTFVASEEGHVWRNWRNYLGEFVPMLFR